MKRGGLQWLFSPQIRAKQVQDNHEIPASLYVFYMSETRCIRCGAIIFGRSLACPSSVWESFHWMALIGDSGGHSWRQCSLPISPQRYRPTAHAIQYNPGLIVILVLSPC